MSIGATRPGQLEHLLHRLTARDEVLRRGMARDAFTEQIELAFALLEEALASGDFVKLRLNGLSQPLHFGPELCALKVELQAFQRVAPARGVSSLDNAVFVALCRAAKLAEIDVASATRARVTADIADERPAHRSRGDAVMMHVLLGHVGVVPLDARFETSCLLVERSSNRRRPERCPRAAEAPHPFQFRRGDSSNACDDAG